MSVLGMKGCIQNPPLDEIRPEYDFIRGGSPHQTSWFSKGAQLKFYDGIRAPDFWGLTSA